MQAFMIYVIMLSLKCHKLEAVLKIIQRFPSYSLFESEQSPGVQRR